MRSKKEEFFDKFLWKENYDDIFLVSNKDELNKIYKWINENYIAISKVKEKMDEAYELGQAEYAWEGKSDELEELKSKLFNKNT
jgi:hypothetical protein